MAEAEAGLELPIGLTEQKFMQQLARIEAKAIGAARKAEQGFVKSNAQIGKSFGGMSGQAKSGLQNVSYQLQDIFVQIQGGQGTVRALSQQLPQLLSGFGLVGGALGLVAAAGIPLVASFFDAGEEAKELDVAVKDLSSALSSYNDAVSAANVPTSELIEKYGLAAGAARAFLEQLAQISQVDAAQAFQASGDALNAALDGLTDRVQRYQDVIAQGYGPEDAAAERQVKRIRDEFGLTIGQAIRLNDLLQSRDTATSMQAQVAATQDLASFLNDAAAQAGYTNTNLNEAAKAASQATLDGLAFKTTLDDGAVSASDLASAIASIDFTNPTAAAQQLSGIMGVMVGQAQGLLDRLGQAAQVARQRLQNSVANGNPLDPLGAFSGGQAASTAVQVNAGGTLRTPDIPDFGKDAPKGRAGGGAKKAGAGRTGREELPFFENMERDIQNLDRELTLIGQSNEAIATAKARWELLDEAKRRGVPVNAELSAQIDAQAEQFGRLTAELEAAEKSQQQFEDAVDGIADAMAGALVAGESLREGLANVLKGIASDILSSGIRSALMGQFAGGGGGGLLQGAMNFLAGGGDKLTGALRLAGARANGGPVNAGSAYLVGERGPEIVVPRNSGHVIPNHKLGGGGNGSVDVRVSVDQNGNLQAFVDKRASGISAKHQRETLRRAEDNAYLWHNNHRKRYT
ncbi:hypothetical protein E4L95_12390 [Paracoccus liaowanqingii]|uniref:Bacteriophage tail tape measure N-terminal domain-containing protein n=1 Tax=Paracoccus liaowanqingii TaxID=2560053 RepID=A0A4Z1CFT3_9RHOB|nr:hypothetical protein [Paracoccus liaowanqingii]TGN58602.1 hypothetical protein E4L95_12390 [Paracoccus liaowanqingii]